MFFFHKSIINAIVKGNFKHKFFSLVKCLSALFFLLFLTRACFGQDYKNAATVTNPYEGKAYKPGDIKTLNLRIPIGKIVVKAMLKYTLLEDPDGMFYSFGHRYKAQINNVVLTSNCKRKIPQEFIDGFSDITIELTDKEIRMSEFQTTEMYYWFKVQDFNLDGKPDFAFIGDLGYHSSPVNYYVWINMDDNLVYWHNLSGVVSEIMDAKKRVISINLWRNENQVNKSYKIEKDTILIPLSF